SSEKRLSNADRTGFGDWTDVRRGEDQARSDQDAAGLRTHSLRCLVRAARVHTDGIYTLVIRRIPRELLQQNQSRKSHHGWEAHVPAHEEERGRGRPYLEPLAPVRQPARSRR